MKRLKIFVLAITFSFFSGAFFRVFALETERTPLLNFHLPVVNELLQSNRFEEALNILRRLTDDYPKHPEVLFPLGIAAIEFSESDDLSNEEKIALLNEAIDVFKTMLSQDPNLVRVNLELGRALFIQGEDSEARKYFRYVLDKELPKEELSNIINFLFNVHDNRFQQDRYEDSLEILRILNDVYPEHPDILLSLGISAVEFSLNSDLSTVENNALLDEAINAFQIILVQIPDSSQINLELARTYFYKNEDIHARKYVKDVLKMDISEEEISNIVDFLFDVHDNRFQQNRYEDAIEIMRMLVEIYPNDPNILFPLSLSAMDISLNPDLNKEERNQFLDEAINALSIIHAQDQTLVRINLELGRAYFLKEKDDLAREHFELALDAEPPEEVVANILGFIFIMNDRRPWNAQIGLSTFYDSNISRKSDEDTIIIYDLPFELDEKGIDSGFGAGMSLGGDYRLYRDKNRQLMLRGQINHRDYDGIKYDSTSMSAGLGLTTGRESHAGVELNASRHWSGRDPNYLDIGGTMKIGHQLKPGLNTGVEVSHYERVYHARGEMDGPGGKIQANLSYQANEKANMNMRASHEYDFPREEIDWRQQRNVLGLGLSLSFPSDLMIGLNLDWQEIDYTGNWYPYTLDGSPRNDKVTSMHLQIWHRDFTLLDFRPRFTLTIEERNTNAQLYDYGRISGELNFTRSL